MSKGPNPVPTEASYTSLIHEFAQQACASNRETPVAIILIGSVARSTHSSRSDLDLLVLGDEPPIVDTHPDRFHVQALNKQEFMKRLEAGDDFAAWCVRYGVPIVTTKAWLDIVGSPEATLWPDWRAKVRHAARRLTLAAALLGTGDIIAAGEEALYAVSHTARAILLKEGVFPLSRPEIISQLQEAKHNHLAKVLEELSYAAHTREALSRDLFYIKRLLVFIDRPTYSIFVQQRRRHAAEKANAEPKPGRAKDEGPRRNTRNGTRRSETAR